MRLPGKHFLRSWSRDSKNIYFTWSSPENLGGPSARPMRVSIEGGEPEEVEEAPVGNSRPVVPYRIAGEGSAAATGDPLHVITTLDGRRVARVSLPRNTIGWQGVRFAPDGRHVVAVVSNSVAPLRILPVAGGEARQLGDARATDTPIGWTPDGQRVIYQTQLDGRIATMAAPVEGGATEEYTIIPDLHAGSYSDPVVVSEDGRYLAYATPTPDSELKTLVIARAADGQTRQITRSIYNLRLFGIAGPGGPPTIGDEFLYREQSDDRVELRAASFDGPSRLLRSFPLDVGTRRVVGVFEDRVVWVEPLGDAAAVMLAEGPDGAPRQLATVEALFEDLVWSPDGRWIAASTYPKDLDAEVGFKIMLIGMTADGEVASSPRFIETQIGVGWGIRWLPDSQALTIFA
jgi:dipeptidyl aminopeptidase/acylaminoacyl peptidase